MKNRKLLIGAILGLFVCYVIFVNFDGKMQQTISSTKSVNTTKESKVSSNTKLTTTLNPKFAD